MVGTCLSLVPLHYPLPASLSHSLSSSLRLFFASPRLVPSRNLCRYDFSPIMLRLIETRQSWLYFLTSVCAILGGVFALTGVLDTIFYRVAETAKTK